jgi:BTB/POZ domain
MTTMPDYIEFDPDGDVALILLNRVGDLDAKGKDAQNTDQAENWAHLDINYPAVIQMRVSSGHLILVSPVFKRLLKGGFAECHTLTSAGTAEISLPDDDPQAMQILLNIIHGHTRKVPREIKFDTLTQISILIDKYCLHEVVEVFTDIWFDKLKCEIPEWFSEEKSMPWLCVSWVLRKADYFERITRVAMRESEGHLEVAMKIPLPIPESILSQYQFSNVSPSPL